MNLLKSDLQGLDQKGFLLKKNVLSKNEIDRVKEIILNQPGGKGVEKSHYPVNFNNFIIKLLKLDFKKIKDGLFLLSIKKRLNLNLISNTIFKDKANLIMIDGIGISMKKIFCHGISINI